MAKRKTLLLMIPEDAPPVREDGSLENGFVRVTSTPLPIDENFNYSRHVYECTPDIAIPDNAFIIRNVGQDWDKDELVSEWPNGCKYVLDALWLKEVENGQFAPIRTKMIDVPEGVEILEEYLPSHQWL